MLLQRGAPACCSVVQRGGAAGRNTVLLLLLSFGSLSLLSHYVATVFHGSGQAHSRTLTTRRPFPRRLRTPVRSKVRGTRHFPHRLRSNSSAISLFGTVTVLLLQIQHRR